MHGPCVVAEASLRREGLLTSLGPLSLPQLLAGGKMTDPHFYPPTVLAGVKPGMRIWTEEVFGPVIVVVSAGAGLCPARPASEAAIRHRHLPPPSDLALPRHLSGCARDEERSAPLAAALRIWAGRCIGFSA